MQDTKKIAIIGVGSAGLTSIKACKEEGLVPVCFEKMDNIGGLWCYRDEDSSGCSSVMDTTVMNSSKDMSAFSDFPPPAEFPNYLHHTLVMKYFQMYAKKFDLLRHVRYNHEVSKVVPAEDYSSTGKWLVTVRNTKEGTSLEEVFDGVMVCSGHHFLINQPTLPGQDSFQGEIVHNHSVKTVQGFKDKKVVVVGIGNSGVDVAVDVSNVALETYVSTRRGAWLMPRVGQQGLPSDSMFQRRINDFKMKLFKYEKFSKAVEQQLNELIDHDVYGLTPQHRVMSQHPTINDVFPSKLLMGLINLRGGIKTLTEKGVIFEGEDKVTEVDAIILATGYRISIPFLSEEILPTKDNKVQLYKNVFPPNLDHHTLAFIGLVQPNGGLFPTFELQARWFALLMNKKRHLPSKEVMIEDIKQKQMERANRYVSSSRHTIEEDWIPYMDTLGRIVQAKPNLLRMAITDPKLFWICFNGPCLPYQYRLTGPHSWSGARDAILTWKSRMETPLKCREIQKEDCSETSLFLWLLPLFGIIIALLWRYVVNVSNYEV